LAHDPRVVEVAKSALFNEGLGAGSSPLLAGRSLTHKRLEEELALLHNTEAALVYSSGYVANLAILTSLLSKESTAICDSLCHASLIEGCRASRSQIKVFKHNDVDHLEAILQTLPTTGNRVIVTDGVYSMDGDFVKLPEINEIARKYDATVLVDDAHANGVVGSNGAGTLDHFKLNRDRIIQVGTLSKAFGAQGGYVVGSKQFIDYVMHKGKAFINSTGLPPVIAAGATEAVRISIAEPNRRAQLIAHVNFLREELKASGFDVLGQSGAPVLAVKFGSSDAAIIASLKLRDHGVYCPPIRPPTVPDGSSRLRIAPMATHSKEEIERSLQAILKTGEV